MFWKNALFLAVACWIGAANAQPAAEEFKEVKISKRIELTVPTSFRKLGEAEMMGRFASIRQPLAVYAEQQGPAYLSVNTAPNQWADDDLAMLQKFYKATFLNTYHELNILREEQATINGQRFVLFEFLGVVKDERNDATLTRSSLTTYNYLAYTVVRGNILVVNFNAPAQQHRRWQPVAERALRSLKLKI